MQKRTIMYRFVKTKTKMLVERVKKAGIEKSNSNFFESKNICKKEKRTAVFKSYNALLIRYNSVEPSSFPDEIVLEQQTCSRRGFPILSVIITAYKHLYFCGMDIELQTVHKKNRA